MGGISTRLKCTVFLGESGSMSRQLASHPQCSSQIAGAINGLFFAFEFAFEFAFALEIEIEIEIEIEDLVVAAVSASG